MTGRYIILRATRGGALKSTHHRSREAADAAWKLVSKHKPIWAILQHLEWPAEPVFGATPKPSMATIAFMGVMK